MMSILNSFPNNLDASQHPRHTLHFSPNQHKKIGKKYLKTKPQFLPPPSPLPPLPLSYLYLHTTFLGSMSHLHFQTLVPAFIFIFTPSSFFFLISSSSSLKPSFLLNLKNEQKNKSQFLIPPPIFIFMPLSRVLCPIFIFTPPSRVPYISYLFHFHLGWQYFVYPFSCFYFFV